MIRLLTICARCDKVQPMTCGADGLTLVAHVSRPYCPLGKFPAEIPDDFDPEEERRRMKSGGCCGTPSAAD